MLSLGAPEILIIVVLYLIVWPAVLCLIVRLLIWFAGVLGIPEALGKFGATLADTFRASRSPDKLDAEDAA